MERALIWFILSLLVLAIHGFLPVPLVVPVILLRQLVVPNSTTLLSNRAAPT